MASMWLFAYIFTYLIQFKLLYKEKNIGTKAADLINITKNIRIFLY